MMGVFRASIGKMRLQGLSLQRRLDLDAAFACIYVALAVFFATQNGVSKMTRKRNMLLVIGLLASLGAGADEVKQVDTKQVRAAMQSVPPMPTNGTWPHRRGYALYETLRRGAGGYIFGQWSLTVGEACEGTANFSSAPPEDEWEEDIGGRLCPNDMLVIEGVFSSSARASSVSEAIDDIELFCGAGGGCNSFQRNQRARNTSSLRRFLPLFDGGEPGMAAFPRGATAWSQAQKLLFRTVTAAQ